MMRMEGRESLGTFSGNRGGLEDARAGATLTGNQQPQPQNPTPQRDRRIVQRTRARGREARDRIGRAEERRRSTRNPRCVIDARMWEAGKTWTEGEKT